MTEWHELTTQEKQHANGLIDYLGRMERDIVNDIRRDVAALQRFVKAHQPDIVKGIVSGSASFMTYKVMDYVHGRLKHG